MNDYTLPPLTPQQNDLRLSVLGYMPFQLTSGQDMALSRLCQFTFERNPGDVFILNGYAGTGKTSLIGAYVRAMHSSGRKIVLLAPTGRAAKVFGNFASMPASTIHRRLYRPVTAAEGTRYTLAPNRSSNTIFIVDEASLIGDDSDIRKSLLQQLIRYVYSGEDCSLILIGDTAQLPPVGQDSSMAMKPDRLISLGLQPTSVLLSEPVRQARESGILVNATAVRRFITGEVHPKRLVLDAGNFPSEVTLVAGNELEDFYTSSISEVGHENTIVITRSNWRANMINRDIRFRILDAEEEIGNGEQILITRNNYFWARNSRNALLANGDMSTVLWIGSSEERYGLRFADAELMFPNRPDPVAAKIMLSTLEMQSANLPMSQLHQLYGLIMNEKEGDIGTRIKSMDNDPYYNALQVKHAYCVTCHKAQGGQWKHVYIDMAGISPQDFGPEFYRWLYTALTRATQRVFLINPTLPVNNKPANF